MELLFQSVLDYILEHYQFHILREASNMQRLNLITARRIWLLAFRKPINYQKSQKTF